MKLSQCMIVKNEEKNIRKALSWGTGIVCEQIVVDTGSTDQTVSIAREMGAKIYNFPWKEDFSAAKNFALTKAMGDWIAFLDADEYFDEKDAAKLHGYLNQIEDYKVEKGREKGNAITCSITHLDSRGGILGYQKQTRLFRNKNYIKYAGRIHEQIQALDGHTLTVVDLTKELTIYHIGYAWTEELRKEKGKRNVMLLKQEVTQRPNHALVNLYLAESLSLEGKHEEAFRYARKAVENIDGSLERERWLSAYQMQLYELNSARKEMDINETAIQKLYEEAIAFDCEYPDFDIAMGYWFYKEQTMDISIRHFESALQKANRYGTSNYSRTIEFLEDIYKKLLKYYEQKQNWHKIVLYGTSFLQLRKYEPGVLLPILNRFLHVEQESTGRVMIYIKKLYDFENRKDLYFLLKHSRLAGFSELEDELKKYLSEDEILKIYGSHDSSKKEII